MLSQTAHAPRPRSRLAWRTASRPRLTQRVRLPLFAGLDSLARHLGVARTALGQHHYSTLGTAKKSFGVCNATLALLLQVYAQDLQLLQYPIATLDAMSRPPSKAPQGKGKGKGKGKGEGKGK